MSFHDFLTNGQPQTRTLRFVRQIVVRHLFEFFKNGLLEIFVDTPASIGHPNQERIVAFLFGCNRYGTMFGKFGGVRQQIDQHLQQPIRIPRGCRKSGGYLGAQLELLVFKKCGRGRDCPCDQVANGYFFLVPY